MLSQRDGPALPSLFHGLVLVGPHRGRVFTSPNPTIRVMVCPTPPPPLSPYASMSAQDTDAETITYEWSNQRNGWVLPYDPDEIALTL